MKQVATTEKEAKERMWDALLGRITWEKADCETCPYEKECIQDNPNFDANYCKVS